MIQRVLLVLLLVSSLCSAHAETRAFVISYSDHPFVTQFLNPLLQAAYQDIGYQVEFVQADGARAHSLFQQQLVDADSVRTSYWLSGYGADLPVIWLDRLQLQLYCRKELPCNIEVLQDPRTLVAIPAQEATYQLFQLDMKARPYFASGYATAKNMLLSGRVDYLLWVEGQLIRALDEPTLQRAADNLRQFDLYHIVDSRHQALLPQLEPALRARIQTFTADSGAH